MKNKKYEYSRIFKHILKIRLKNSRIFTNLKKIINVQTLINVNV